MAPGFPGYQNLLQHPPYQIGKEPAEADHQATQDDVLHRRRRVSWPSHLPRKLNDVAVRTAFEPPRWVTATRPFTVRSVRPVSLATGFRRKRTCRRRPCKEATSMSPLPRSTMSPQPGNHRFPRLIASRSLLPERNVLGEKPAPEVMAKDTVIRIAGRGAIHDRNEREIVDALASAPSAGDLETEREKIQRRRDWNIPRPQCRPDERNLRRNRWPCSRGFRIADPVCAGRDPKAARWSATSNRDRRRHIRRTSLRYAAKTKAARGARLCGSRNLDPETGSRTLKTGNDQASWLERCPLSVCTASQLARRLHESINFCVARNVHDIHRLKNGKERKGRRPGGALKRIIVIAGTVRHGRNVRQSGYRR